MSRRLWQRIFSVLLVAGMLVGFVQPVSAVVTAPLADNSEGVLQVQNTLDKVEELVLEEIGTDGATDFFVWMAEKADLSPAYDLKTKEEKGQFVFETLRATAERTQADLRSFLDKQGIEYKPFYIANKILVFAGDNSLVSEIAAHPDVAEITANHKYQLQEPFKEEVLAAPAAIESNITFINADDAWALGVDGSGTLMAGNDTGLDETHPTIAAHYRGCMDPPTCSTWDHNYNWWDATGTYPTDPWDGHGHGTHTTGTMVGDDGGANQIGVAPGAQTVHCKNMTDGGSGDDGTFTECFQWDLAPWDLSGANPDPAMAPDAVNNSWGYWGGGQSQFEDEIAALQAAGIAVEVSAGNEGSGCSTLRSPGDYEQVLTTGSVNHAGGVLPGTLTGFSSRGPSSLYPNDYFPDIMAPGENIRSALPGNSYGSWGGTSMSGPHTTALVGLMWDANPALAGDVAMTFELIRETAVPLTGQGGSNCGGDYTDGPNNDWGHGTIDALAAVQAAFNFGGTGTLEGNVTDSSSSDPLQYVDIEASLTPTTTWTAQTDALGDYSMVVFSGTYTVTASLFGYIPDTVSGVTVISGSVTTQDFALDPAPSAQVYGYVTDVNTGWPLYASLDIAGYPGGGIWSDPVTGYYEVSMPTGSSYDFHVAAFVGGYVAQNVTVGPVTGDMQQDFALDVDVASCSAPGYSPTYSFFDDFENGYGNWTMNGLWNAEAESDTCGALVAPFPSSANASWYGVDGQCTFNIGNTNSGELTMINPVSLPAGGSLSLWSFEETECGGDCPYDNRYIQISTDGGGTWTTLAEGNVEGQWLKYNLDLSAYSGMDVLFRFHFDTVDSVDNSYFGWMVDDVSVATGCLPQPGGLVVGNVYEDNFNTPLTGAMVYNDSGEMTFAEVTTDPNVDDAFYTLFSPAGSHVFTATMTDYNDGVEFVDVVDGDTVGQDFYLSSGALVVDPTSLHVTVQMGSMVTEPMTLTNVGTGDAYFEISEQDKGFVPTLLEVNTELYNEQIEIGAMSVRSPEAQELRLGSLGNIPLSWNNASQIPMGNVRYAHAQCVDNSDSFYVISGVSNGSIINNAWRYDAGTDIWNNLAPIPVGQEGSSAVCYGDYIYVTGGGGTNQFYIYDIVGDTWFSGTPLPRNVWGAAMGAVDGKVYMIGGDSDFSFGGTSNQVDIYDIAGGTWSTGSPMPLGVVTSGHTQAGNHIYVVGGWSDSSPGSNSNMSQRYDMSTDTWEVGPSFTSARADLALTITQGGIYAIGGDADGGGPFDASNTVEALDWTAWPGGSWMDIGDPLPVGLSANNAGFCTNAMTGGEVWSTGGIDINFIWHADNQYRPSDACFFGGIDVPWLSEDPISGTVSAGLDQLIDVTFDASVISQPGDYLAELKIDTDTPYPALTVPVTMTVVPPSTYGKLEGTVNGLGYCDADPVVLEEAEVYIESSTGMTWTLQTDASGYYGYWLDEVGSPYEVTVTYPEHETGNDPNVIIVGTQTTTLDFDLRWLEPCLSLAPLSLETTLGLGDMDTQQITLTNVGAASGAFEVSDSEQGYYPLLTGGQVTVNVQAGATAAPSETAVAAGEYSARPTRTHTVNERLAPEASPNVLLLNADDDNDGYSPIYDLLLAYGDLGALDLYDARIGTPTLSELEPYDVVVVWANYVFADATAMGNVLADYVDGGGRVIDLNFGIDPNWGYQGRFRVEDYTAMKGIGTSYVTDCLGSYDPSHPVMESVTDLCDLFRLSGTYLTPESTDIATYNDGEVAVAVKDNGTVVTINAYPGVYYQWTGQLDLIMHNAIFFLLGGGDAIWLTENPLAGIVDPDGGMQAIDVTFDAGMVSQPGTYLATVDVDTDDPVIRSFEVPVTMTVTAPADWGRLEGVVQGLGYCDANPVPLEEVIVWPQGAISVTTDATGYYAIWLGQGTYTVTAEYEGHTPGEAQVVITGGGTTVQDFNLRWLAPCVSVDPNAFDVTVGLGYSMTHMLELMNTGAANSSFGLTEKNGGFAPGLLGAATPEIATRMRTDAFYANAASTADILTPGGTETLGLLGAGDVLDQWPAVSNSAAWGITGVGEDAIWVGDGWGTLNIYEYLPDGTPTGLSWPYPWSPAFGPADDTYNQNSGTVWTLDVGGDNCLHEMDTSSGYTGNTICSSAWSISQRGLAYDPTTDSYFVGGWNDLTVYHIDSTGSLIQSWYLGLSISGLAYHFEAGLLFIIENSPTDTVSVFDVASGSIIDSFTIPGFGSYGGAGLEVACDGNLWAVNQANDNVYLVDSGVPGSLCAPSDIPWLYEDPVTGTVGADSSFFVDLIFDASVLTETGDYSGTLKVKSEDPMEDMIEVPLTLHVVPPAFGVDLSGNDVLSGIPDEIVMYTLVVTNASNGPMDTFDVSVGSSVFPAVPDVTQVGPLAAGESAIFQVAVQIPDSALPGESDAVDVMVTSQGDNTKLDTATLTTSVGGSYGVMMHTDQTEGSGLPDGTVTYTVRLTNTGSLQDTILLTYWDVEPGWTVHLVADSFDLVGGESVDTLFHVFIPSNAVAGDWDMLMLQAKSSHDPSKWNEMEFMATVNVPQIYLPFINRH